MGGTDLQRLLRGLFSSEELLPFLGEVSGRDDLAAAIPGRGATPDEVSHAASLALERRGLVDRHLVRRLLHARPGRVREVRTFAVGRGLALAISEEVDLLLEQGFDATARVHVADLVRDQKRDRWSAHESSLAFAQLAALPAATTTDEQRFALVACVRTLAEQLDADTRAVSPVEYPASSIDTRARAIHNEIDAAIMINDGERAALRLYDLTCLRSGSRETRQHALLLSAEIHAWRQAHTSLHAATPTARERWLSLLREVLSAADAANVAGPSSEGTAPMVGRTPRPSFRGRALCKRYRGSLRSQLLEVDLELRPGMLVGVVGPNGAGKTTLLRVVAGELAVDSGTLEYPALDGPRADLDWREIRRRIGYVRQHLVPWHGPLADNLHAWAAHHGLRGQANADAVASALKRLRLEDLQGATWAQLSGGFQTRFELARVLLPRPRLIVLDEPLAPLDIVSQQRFLRDLRDLGTAEPEPPAILISSQHIHEIEQVADQIVYLRGDGRVEFMGHPGNLGDDEVQQVFELVGDIRPEVRDELARRFGPSALQDIAHGVILWAACGTRLRGVLEIVHAAGGSLTHIRDITRSTARLLWEGAR